MKRFFKTFFVLFLGLAQNSFGENADVYFDCMGKSSIYQGSLSQLGKVVSLDIKGRWASYTQAKEKDLNNCDKKFIQLYVASEKHFLNEDIKEYQCERKNNAIACEDLLIDECCLLHWKEQEILKWVQLLK